MRIAFTVRLLLVSTVIVLSSVTALTQQPSSAFPARIQDQIDSLAASAAQKIISANTEVAHPKVIVMDFSQDSRHFTIFGRNLAEQFSSALLTHAKSFSVLDRNLLRAYVKDKSLDIEALSFRGVAEDVAEHLGADALIIGEIEKHEDGQMVLRIRVLSLGPAEAMKIVFSPTEEMRKQSVSPISLSQRPAPEDSSPDGPEVWPSNTPGVSSPSCSYCPSPSLTNEARKAGARLRETVKLSVIVTKDGSAEAIRLSQGAPYMLNEQAIAAVKGWKFKPGSKDGEPVNVRITIEIVFKSLK